VTQTTLSMDDTARVIEALRAKFEKIEGPRKDDICYATQNRQDAVKILAAGTELLLVVGSPNSSNSNRLRELGERMGAKAYLIDSADEIQKDWLDGIESIGITAGASAPEVLVQSVVDRLKEWGGEVPEELKGQEENVVFSLPQELRLTEVE
jgi:4-hydroxy-3-methylbut-2-enyl diphosphate reductase